MAEKLVFVTVGTTRFDALIEAVCSQDCIRALKKKGYNRVRVQVGRGEARPSFDRLDGVEIEWYDFKPSLERDILNAALVIGHAGAGTCMEVLEANKPMIVVINETLADNHQFELAERLFADGHLLYTTTSKLTEVVSNMDISNLAPYQSGNPSLFSSFLDKALGFE
eukprot:m.153306 g.153306  ORF g.153306 m.153306 type:complete len:167 (-) comp15064_c0_seq10:1852-2352(-)